MTKTNDSTLGGQAREVILNVYSSLNKFKHAAHAYMVEHSNDAPIIVDFLTAIGCDFSKPFQVTSKMVGVCERTVRRYHSYQTTREDLEPQHSKKGRKKTELPEWCLGAIRDIIICDYGFKGENGAPLKYPSISTVLRDFYQLYPGTAATECVPRCGDIPLAGKTTFERYIKKAGFRFIKNQGSHRAFIIPKEDASIERLHYLRTIARFRAEGKRIYFMDETWANKGHRRQQLWLRLAGEKGALSRIPENVYRRGINLDETDGQRLFIVVFMSEMGIVKNSVKVFVGKDDTTDYHEGITAEHFEKYIREQVINELEPNSVVVMDKALHNSKHYDSGPGGKKKSDIVRWLVGKGESTEEHLNTYTVTELQDICKKYKSHTDFLVDKILAEKGIQTLCIPTMHCELNAIEMMWTQIKGFVFARNANKSCTLRDIGSLILEAFNYITMDYCHRACQHVKKMEEIVFEAEMTMDPIAERMSSEAYPSGGDSNTDEEGEDQTEDSVVSRKFVRTELDRQIERLWRSHKKDNSKRKLPRQYGCACQGCCIRLKCPCVAKGEYCNHCTCRKKKCRNKRDVSVIPRDNIAGNAVSFPLDHKMKPCVSGQAALSMMPSQNVPL